MAYSPELTGGAGFTFENAVSAIYLSSLLIENTAPGLKNGQIVTRVALQQANFGEPLDDLIVDSQIENGRAARLSLQVKRRLRISAAKTNIDFQEIILCAYETLKKSSFCKDVDRVGAIVGTISDASKRALETICEWARASTSADTFMKRFEHTGSANKQYREIVQAVQTILSSNIESNAQQEEIHQLFSHFIIIRLDMMHEGSVEEANIITHLRTSLHADEVHRASDLWYRLRIIASEGAGRAAEFNRAALLRDLSCAFRFKGAPSLRNNLQCLSQEANLTLGDIVAEIDDVIITRPQCVDRVDELIKQHSFVQIIGLPGTGKSVILRKLANKYLQRGPILVLKADRLNGATWSFHAQALGLSACELEKILSEIAAVGAPILFIDGLDRVEISNRGIVLDLINTILKYPSLKTQWRIVATLRDSGIEPLRTWLPSNFLGDVATFEVQPFNDEEAKLLADAKPLLRPLLFGDKNVREISRRPFFAAVLLRTINLRATGAIAPSSEIELIDAWWMHNSCNSPKARLMHRQRTLIELAKAGAATMGRCIKLDERINLDVIEELKLDGILKDERPGHSVKFSHDIFFEWSFFHLLIDKENTWLEEIKAIGEPPVLGRVVELLSQDKFLHDSNWEANLIRIEQSCLRSQWARAWLLGPIGIPEFLNRSSIFTKSLLQNNNSRLTKLAVWFQAEKTRANPFVLDGTLQIEKLSRFETMQLADALAWPSDFSTWKRCCEWLLDQIPHCTCQEIPEILSVFEVWQNALVNVLNSTSVRIIETVQRWLEDIENRLYPEVFQYDRGFWTDLKSGALEELETRLRTLLFHSARIMPERVKEYLHRVQAHKRIRKNAFEQILLYSSILSEKLSLELVELVLAELKRELPADVARKPSARGDFSTSFSHHDWDQLAINYDPRNFSPSSPLREPFASLFQKAPVEALRLVRELTNHAIIAWRQLYTLDSKRQATPIMLTLQFPWGNQSFWGNEYVYLWFQSHRASNVIESGLMALENWAFSEIEKGRNIDNVIQDVLVGHESCSVLRIAVAIALTYNHTSPVTLPLATCQHLWHWDINRRVQESSLASGSLFGFNRKEDLKHAEAVRSLGNRTYRNLIIRSLASLFILNSDKTLQESARKAIQAFPENLPFSFEEERVIQRRVQELFRTAELWSEYSKLENYSAMLTEDGKNYIVEFNSAKAGDPDVVVATKQHANLEEQLGLLNWIQESFEHKKLSTKWPITKAIESAKSLDANELFEKQQGIDIEDDNRRSVLAGVAAIVLSFPENLKEAELNWAQDIIFRTVQTPEHLDNMRFSGSSLLFHPCIYAANGLIAMIRHNIAVLKAKCELIRLAGHPMEQVSATVIASALNLWSIDADFAWFALELGIKISIGVVDRKQLAVHGYDYTSQVNHNAASVAEVIYQIKMKMLPPKMLTTLPAPWVLVAPKQGKNKNKQCDSKPYWCDPDIYLRWDFLPKILKSISVKHIMLNPLYREPFLVFCNAMVAWTVEKLAPSWLKDDKYERQVHHSNDLFEWRSNLYLFLGKVSQYISAVEAKNNFLDPIMALDEEITISLLQPFIEMLVCLIMDLPHVETNIVSLLEICTSFLLQLKVWDAVRIRGGMLYGFDLPKIVPAVFFVNIEHARGANRFANSDWSEIEKVLSIIDPFVRKIGDIPSVMSSFLTLCERAVNFYPAVLFVEQIREVLVKQNGIPIGWRGTRIPSRIAALIWALAENNQPLPGSLSQSMLRILDALIDMGDRRAAAMQTSEIFKNVRI